MPTDAQGDQDIRHEVFLYTSCANRGKDTEPSEDSYAWETMSESLVCRFTALPLITQLNLTIRRNWLLFVQLH